MNFTITVTELQLKKQSNNLCGNRKKNKFFNLFGIPILEEDEITNDSLVGEYISNWIKFKKLLNAEGERFLPPFKRIKELYDTGKISENTYQEFAELNKFRNELVHGHKEPEKKNLTMMSEILSKSVETLTHII